MSNPQERARELAAQKSPSNTDSPSALILAMRAIYEEAYLAAMADIVNRLAKPEGANHATNT